MIELGDRLYPEQGKSFLGLWEHPTDPCKVIKRVRYTDPWFSYASILWAKKPRNEHLPRVFDIYCEDDTAYVTMERLFHLTDKWEARIEGLEWHVLYGLPILNPELLCLLPALKLIRRFFVNRRFGVFDIHYYNLMMRPNGCIVFSDPIY